MERTIGDLWTTHGPFIRRVSWAAGSLEDVLRKAGWPPGLHKLGFDPSIEAQISKNPIIGIFASLEDVH